MTPYCINALDFDWSNQQVAAKLDCPTDDTTEMMNCLKAVPAEELYKKGFDCTVGYCTF